ncbi:MAG: hypothetical protein E6J87_13715 [Deltaproteobacteria bacterium]|nr:MAG: hypothetical protein E6J87_13715 [Deltaproteobacteria bacterium]
MRGSRCAAWVMLWCCGCAVGPNFAAPSPPSAQRYGSEPIPTRYVSAAGEEQRVQLGEEIKGRWWTLLQSPEIDALLDRAIAGSRTLASARATLAQSRDAVAAARGELLPQVTGSASAERQRFAQVRSVPLTSKGPISNLYSIGADVS